MEILLISKLKSNQREYGYNHTIGGDAPCTVPLKRVNLYKTSGKFIKTFDSVKDTALYVDCQPCSISMICKNKKSYKGFLARYYDDVNNTNDIDEYYPYNSMAIHQFDWNKNFIKTWKGSGEAGRFYNIEPNCILSACKYHVYYMNFIWRKDEDIIYINNVPTLKDDDCKNNSNQIIVYQFTMEGIFVDKYISISEASRKTNIDNPSIFMCISNQYYSAGGYIWKTEENVIKNNNTYTIKNFKPKLHNKGNEIFIFTNSKMFVNKYESYAEALEYIQGNRVSVRHAVKNGTLYKNYYWKLRKDIIEKDGVFFIKEN